MTPSSLPSYLTFSSGFGSSSCSLLVSSSDHWLVVVLYLAPHLLCCCRPLLWMPDVMVGSSTLLSTVAAHFCRPPSAAVLLLSLPAAARLSHKWLVVASSTCSIRRLLAFAAPADGWLSCPLSLALVTAVSLLLPVPSSLMADC